MSDETWKFFSNTEHIDWAWIGLKMKSLHTSAKEFGAFLAMLPDKSISNYLK